MVSLNTACSRTGDGFPHLSKTSTVFESPHAASSTHLAHRPAVLDLPPPVHSPGGISGHCTPALHTATLGNEGMANAKLRTRLALPGTAKSTGGGVAAQARKPEKKAVYRARSEYPWSVFIQLKGQPGTSGLGRPRQSRSRPAARAFRHERILRPDQTVR